MECVVPVSVSSGAGQRSRWPLVIQTGSGTRQGRDLDVRRGPCPASQVSRAPGSGVGRVLACSSVTPSKARVEALARDRGQDVNEHLRVVAGCRLRSRPGRRWGR